MTGPDKYKENPPKPKQLFRRGTLAITISAAIAVALALGWAAPYPDLQTAYLICAGFATWGFTDLIRAAA